MDNTVGYVLVSAFAVLGVIYLSSLVIEILLKKRYRNVFVVVPAYGVDDELYEMMSFLHEMGPFGEKIILELGSLGENAGRLVAGGYCKAVLKPYELVPYIKQKTNKS